MLNLDRAALELAHDWRSPTLDILFATLTWLGSLAVLLPLLAVAAALCWRRGRRKEAVFLLAALVLAPLVGLTLKFLLARPRPDLYPALIDVASSLSFPSIHAMQATAAALAVALVLQSRLLWLPLLLLTLLVALSRLYLQVHYPSDVLAGIVISAACTGALYFGLRLPSSRPHTE